MIKIAFVLFLNIFTVIWALFGWLYFYEQMKIQAYSPNPYAVDATNSPTVKQRSKNKNNRFYLNFESALLIFISLVAAITIILIQYVINKN